MKQNAKIKVLQVTSGFRKGISGGIPSVLYNYCTASAFDDDEVGFDYLALGYQTFEPYRAELEKGGGVLYDLGIHVSGMKRNFQIYKNLRKFLKEHKGEYDIVHINSGALVQVLAAALAAKSVGVGKVIIHSHNAMVKAKSREIVYKFLKPLFYLCVDEYLSCSEKAAISMFPKKILCDKKWIMVQNAVDINRFVFDERIRNQYREDYNLEGKFVIGHVGRFNRQKNHEFLVDVFSEVCKQRDDAMLLLVGTGDLQDNIQRKVANLGLTDRIIFTGQRRDASCFMQAMDVFVLPSLYEGFPVVSIEAQASGLKAILSDEITKETGITECIRYMSLLNPNEWVEYLVCFDADYDRRSYFNEIKKAGYELSEAACRLKRLFIDLYDKEHV